MAIKVGRAKTETVVATNLVCETFWESLNKSSRVSVLKKWLSIGKQQKSKQKRAILIKKASMLVVGNIVMQSCSIYSALPLSA